MTKIDPIKALADTIFDAVVKHMERASGIAATKATNATDNQAVRLALSVKIERNERGRYVITPKVKTGTTETDTLETPATVFDPAQMSLGMESEAV